MKKFTVISMAALSAAMTFVGCNSTTYEPGEETASSVAISSFSLSKDTKVLANLDTVFFSIDLNNAQIFNADSLPYGTPVNKLVPVIKMLDNVSKAEIKVQRANGTDTVYNYLLSSTDSIDFSNGPAYLTVASPSGDLERTYTIKVNVHKLVSDSLMWSETARTELPTSLAALTAQRTVKMGSKTYCLTTDTRTWAIARREGAEGEWSNYNVEMPSDAYISEFCASDEALYIIAGGKLHKSVDEGRSWSDTGLDVNHLYGAYGNSILYAVNNSGKWFTGMYPEGAVEEMQPGMPVTGTSQIVNFSFPLAGSVIATMVGGRDSDDILCADTWGFDGSSWARISTVPLPAAYEGMTLVPFFVFTVSSTFEATRHSILLAFNGQNDSDMNDKVYISGDCGRTWRLAGSLLQLPEYFPMVANAQAFLETIVLGSRSCGEWLDFPTNYILPATARVLPPMMPLSRATEPVTSWDCPYIYFYGGTLKNGTLNPYIWRGTINRMTFKPIL